MNCQELVHPGCHCCDKCIALQNESFRRGNYQPCFDALLPPQHENVCYSQEPVYSIPTQRFQDRYQTLPPFFFKRRSDFDPSQCVDPNTFNTLSCLRERACRFLETSNETRMPAEEWGPGTRGGGSYSPSKQPQSTFDYEPQSTFLKRMKLQNDTMMSEPDVFRRGPYEHPDYQPQMNNAQEVPISGSMLSEIGCPEQGFPPRMQYFREQTMQSSDVSSIHDSCTCYRTWRPKSPEEEDELMNEYNELCREILEYEEALENEINVCNDIDDICYDDDDDGDDDDDDDDVDGVCNDDLCDDEDYVCDDIGDDLEEGGARAIIAEKAKARRKHVSRYDRRRIRRKSKKRLATSPKPGQTAEIDFEPSLKKPHPNSCERCWRYASPSRSPVNKPYQRYDPNFRRSHSDIYLNDIGRGAEALHSGGESKPHDYGEERGTKVHQLMSPPGRSRSRPVSPSRTGVPNTGYALELFNPEPFMDPTRRESSSKTGKERVRSRRSASAGHSRRKSDDDLGPRSSGARGGRGGAGGLGYPKSNTVSDDYDKAGGARMGGDPRGGFEGGSLADRRFSGPGGRPQGGPGVGAHTVGRDGAGGGRMSGGPVSGARGGALSDTRGEPRKVRRSSVPLSGPPMDGRGGAGGGRMSGAPQSGTKSSVLSDQRGGGSGGDRVGGGSDGGFMRDAPIEGRDGGASGRSGKVPGVVEVKEDGPQIVFRDDLFGDDRDKKDGATDDSDGGGRGRWIGGLQSSPPSASKNRPPSDRRGGPGSRRTNDGPSGDTKGSTPRDGRGGTSGFRMSADPRDGLRGGPTLDGRDGGSSGQWADRPEDGTKSSATDESDVGGSERLGDRPQSGIRGGAPSDNRGGAGGPRMSSVPQRGPPMDDRGRGGGGGPRVSSPPRGGPPMDESGRGGGGPRVSSPPRGGPPIDDRGRGGGPRVSSPPRAGPPMDESGRGGGPRVSGVPQGGGLPMDDRGRGGGPRVSSVQRSGPPMDGRGGGGARMSNVPRGSPHMDSRGGGSGRRVSGVAQGGSPMEGAGRMRGSSMDGRGGAGAGRLSGRPQSGPQDGMKGSAPSDGRGGAGAGRMSGSPQNVSATDGRDGGSSGRRGDGPHGGAPNNGIDGGGGGRTRGGPQTYPLLDDRREAGGGRLSGPYDGFKDGAPIYGRIGGPSGRWGGGPQGGTMGGSRGSALNNERDRGGTSRMDGGPQGGPPISGREGADSGQWRGGSPGGFKAGTFTGGRGLGSVAGLHGITDDIRLIASDEDPCSDNDNRRDRHHVGSAEGKRRGRSASRTDNVQMNRCLRKDERSRGLDFDGKIRSPSSAFQSSPSLFDRNGVASQMSTCVTKYGRKRRLSFDKEVHFPCSKPESESETRRRPVCSHRQRSPQQRPDSAGSVRCICKYIGYLQGSTQCPQHDPDGTRHDSPSGTRTRENYHSCRRSGSTSPKRTPRDSPRNCERAITSVEGRECPCPNHRRSQSRPKDTRSGSAERSAERSRTPLKYCVFYMNKIRPNKANDIEVLIEELTQDKSKRSPEEEVLKEKMSKMKDVQGESMALRFQKGVTEACQRPEYDRVLYF